MRLTANHRRRFRPSIAVAQPTQIVHFTKLSSIGLILSIAAYNPAFFPFDVASGQREPSPGRVVDIHIPR